MERFHQQGLAALLIGPEQRARIVQEWRRAPDRQEDGTATWSLMTLRESLRKQALPQVGVSPIRQVLHEAGYRFGKSRTWCPTGTALRVRKAGTVTVEDPKAEEKQWIELAYEQAEAAGIMHLCEDEAGPSQAMPQPGEDWHLEGKPGQQPHEYEYVRGGTAKLLTLFRPATGEVRVKGVLAAPNAVLHPWLQEQLQAILAQLDREPLAVRVPLPQGHPLMLTWQHWWWSYQRPKPAPALRLILVWDHLAGHLSSQMVRWRLQPGILPLYTPLSGSWPNMAESVQRIIVRRALAGQHPKDGQQVIDWVEQTVVGWNNQPTPFVWNGKRRRGRERARLRRLGGSGAAVMHGSSIAA